MKYNISKIMKRAHELKALKSLTMAESMRKSWKIEKERVSFNSLVRKNAESSKKYGDAYNSIYNILNDLYSVDIVAEAEKTNKKKIDVVESMGLMSAAYEVATHQYI
ncbi:MAG: hypothetical protein GY679_01415 [Mycoplasma sp.]|nr:hypothetical protein [Mycoplasma sp.]